MRLSRNWIAGGCIGAAILAITGCGSKETAPATAVNGPALGDPHGSAQATQANAAAQSSTAQPWPRRPPPNTGHPKVQIETSMGNITVELDAVNAPLTADNFLTYVDQGFYDGTVFHYVVKDYVILGGGYDQKMVEKPARTDVRNEAHNGLLNRRGTIAMARREDAIDSARSQFFFNLRDNRLLDHKDRTLRGYGYCVFGKVIEGEAVLDAIGAVEVHNTDQFDQVPVQPVIIRSAHRIP